MNCQDIARILDDQDTTGLSAADQQSVNAHLASCHECASEWQLHAQLAATVMPALPQSLLATCRTLVIAGSGVDSSARIRSRLILGGTLLAVAAAAAMLGMQLFGPTPLEVAATTVPGTSLPAAPAPIEAAEAVMPPERSAEEAAVTTPPAPISAQSFTVSVMPLNHHSDLPASRAVVDSFYASFLQELRKVPNLKLVDSRAAAEYRIAVRGLAVDAPTTEGFTTTSRVGGVNALDTDGQWRVEVVAEVAGRKLAEGSSFRQSKDAYENVNISIAAADSRYASEVGGLLVGHCPEPVTQPNSYQGLCSDPAVMAASQVASLRQRVFPPDASIQRQMLAQLQDPAVSGGLSLAKVQFQSLLRARRVIWDSPTIHAVFDLAATNPDPRDTSWWGALRGVKSPVLVPLLLDAVRNGASEQVRLGALSVLQYDFASEPMVRAALESLGREAPQELVRQAAQRILYGDAGWRNYVVANLENTTLSDEARLAPLDYAARSGELTGQLPAIMDADATAALAAMLPRLWSDPEQTKTVLQVLGVLGRTGHPGAVPLVTEALRNAPEGQLMPLVMSIASGSYRNEPRVQKALDDAGARSPQLRSMVDGLRQAAPQD